MTIDELIAEGRRLQRPVVLLLPYGEGAPAAVWHDEDQDESDETGERRWLTFDGSAVPGPPVDGIFTLINTEGTKRGRVEAATSLPIDDGVPLYPVPADVLPPIDAVFARGSARVGEWLRANDRERGWRYNSNFKDRELVSAYERVEQAEHPFFTDAAPAALGGWHLGWAEHDWHDLIDEQLVAHTFWDSEPWVELWRLRSGEFKVIPRIT